MVRISKERDINSIDAVTAIPPPTEQIDYRALALRHGLQVSGARPSVGQYLGQVWGRRHFILAFSHAKLTTRYSQAKLGQAWQVVNPLLNAMVFYLVFGVLLGTRRGVADYIPFLVTGVFVWTFTQQSATAGVKAISGNLGLLRALHFPRASLPLALCIQQLQQLLFSMAALVVILLCFGVPVAASWLLAIPALVLQSTFNAGVSMIMARMGAKTPDMYIQVRRMNGISWARSGVLEPMRATISASPVLKRNCSTRIGRISSQDRPG